MTSRDFAYWLQEFFELNNPKEINPEQTQIIKNHLNMVFLHEIDPSMGDKTHQDMLNNAHSGTITTSPAILESTYPDFNPTLHNTRPPGSDLLRC
jgi:hypothetical protein